MEVAGQDITSKVQAMMKRDFGEEQAGSLRVMQALKEKVCRVERESSSAMKGPDNDDEEAKSFELPDGTVIQVKKEVRTGAPEVLFGAGDPSAPSMQKICNEAITTCDLDSDRTWSRASSWPAAPRCCRGWRRGCGLSWPTRCHR